jgi:hypothetical protein
MARTARTNSTMRGCGTIHLGAKETDIPGWDRWGVLRRRPVVLDQAGVRIGEGRAASPFPLASFRQRRPNGLRYDASRGLACCAVHGACEGGAGVLIRPPVARRMASADKKVCNDSEQHGVPTVPAQRTKRVERGGVSPDHAPPPPTTGRRTAGEGRRPPAWAEPCAGLDGLALHRTPPRRAVPAWTRTWGIASRDFHEAQNHVVAHG